MSISFPVSCWNTDPAAVLVGLQASEGGSGKTSVRLDYNPVSPLKEICGVHLGVGPEASGRGCAPGGRSGDRWAGLRPRGRSRRPGRSGDLSTLPRPYSVTRAKARPGEQMSSSRVCRPVSQSCAGWGGGGLIYPGRLLRPGAVQMFERLRWADTVVVSSVCRPQDQGSMLF